VVQHGPRRRRRTLNQRVVGSSPTRFTSFFQFFISIAEKPLTAFKMTSLPSGKIAFPIFSVVPELTLRSGFD